MAALLQVRVVAPSQKMAKKLPGALKLTTPAPHVLAAMYRKALRAPALTPDTVADILASALNARFVPALAYGLCLLALFVKVCRSLQSMLQTVLCCSGLHCGDAGAMWLHIPAIICYSICIATYTSNA